MSDNEDNYSSNSASDSEDEYISSKPKISLKKTININSYKKDNNDEDDANSAEESSSEIEDNASQIASDDESDLEKDDEPDEEDDEPEDDPEEDDDEDIEKNNSESEEEYTLGQKKTTANSTGKKNNKSNKKKTPLIIDDEDDEDDYDENYLQKFDHELTKSYINEFHPECLSHNYDEISKLSVVVRDENGIVCDPLHLTVPVLTKFEKTRILGQRTKQLASGAKPFVKIPENMIESNLIAELELREKKLPFIIKRPLPGGKFEYWNLKDLEVI